MYTLNVRGVDIAREQPLPLPMSLPLAEREIRTKKS